MQPRLKAYSLKTSQVPQPSSQNRIFAKPRVRISSGLPKSLYFNLFSIAKQCQFDGIHSTIKPYHKTCEDDVQTLGLVIVRELDLELGLNSRFLMSRDRS